MLTSLYTGVSGIKANMIALSVVGNNIANVNSYGFKESKPYFSDVLNKSLGRGSGQVGMGVKLNCIDTNFNQGLFETTSNALDLAINGDGFFMLKDAGGLSSYTRAGHFILDKDGNIVNTEGLFLQGYQADASGTVQNSIGNLRVATNSSPPRATTKVTIGANVESSAEILTDPFDVDNADATSNFSTGVTVHDSLGNTRPVTMYFRKATESATGNSWEWYAVIEAADAASGAREIAAQGTVDFDPTGALDTESAVTYPTDGFDFNGGASADQQIDFDFGTSITEGGTGLDGLTQFGSPSSVALIQQDGYEAGVLQGIAILDDGTVNGAFTNGTVMALGQVALATFASPNGLIPAGGMRYEESADSGAPMINKPGNQGVGSITSSALELSNVDLAEEFVKMITAQRGFQANSKIITTTDEVLMELVNLKR